MFKSCIVLYHFSGHVLESVSDFGLEAIVRILEKPKGIIQLWRLSETIFVGRKSSNTSILISDLLQRLIKPQNSGKVFPYTYK